MSDRKTGLCLSVQQPWAWLIIRPDVTDAAARAELSRRNEIKPVENRTWPTKVRGWIGIHAGKKIDAEGLAFVRREFPQIALPESFDVGGIVGRVRLVDCVEDYDSPWFFGPLGFVVADAEPLPFTPCRGQLGFFRPDLNFTAPGNSDPLHRETRDDDRHDPPHLALVDPGVGYPAAPAGPEKRHTPADPQVGKQTMSWWSG